MSFEIKHPNGGNGGNMDGGQNGWVIKCKSGPDKDTLVVVNDITAAANFVFTSLYAAQRMGIQYEVSLTICHSPKPGPVKGEVPDFLPPDIS